MGRPIFAFNPKSPSPDWSTSMKVMATTRTRCLYIRVQSVEYIRMERNIYEPTAGHIDGQPVWKYFTPRDVIYNFITESIYRCSDRGRRGSIDLDGRVPLISYRALPGKTTSDRAEETASLEMTDRVEWYCNRNRDFQDLEIRVERVCEIFERFRVER